MSKKVVIAGACRTAIGTMGGSLSTTPAVKLGSIVIEEALKRAGVEKSAVDFVYMGCVIQAGQGQNVARQASVNAGLPIETPAVTLNVVCGSGLYSVNAAAAMIQNGDADIVVAGGMENMSMAPFAMPQGRYGYRMTWPSQSKGALVDTMVNDALWDAFNDYHMITTADNVARQWGLTREELDEFAVASQNKAVAAQESGAFDKEIVPVVSALFSEIVKSFNVLTKDIENKDELKKTRKACDVFDEYCIEHKLNTDFVCLTTFKDDSRAEFVVSNKTGNILAKEVKN